MATKEAPVTDNDRHNSISRHYDQPESNTNFTTIHQEPTRMIQLWWVSSEILLGSEWYVVGSD